MFNELPCKLELEVISISDEDKWQVCDWIDETFDSQLGNLVLPGN